MTLALRLDRDKLAKGLGLLGSAHDGEVLSAARMANTLVRSAGVTWHQLLDPKVPVPGAELDVAAWKDSIVSACLSRPDLLTDWELDFLISLRRFRQLSPKQSQILGRIFSKVRTESQ
jgi:hypothetical protein